jgi:hypothetical protein
MARVPSSPVRAATALLPRLPGVSSVADSLNAMLASRRIRTEWAKAGRPVPPPPQVKQGILKRYAKQFCLQAFIETGTFFGDTAAAMVGQVANIVTIEISSDLAERARERFAQQPEVRVLEGDSGKLLPTILEDLREPALFWLDGHYSGGITGRGDEDTPIRIELGAILDHPLKTHVVLIDDARDFTGGAYPTIDELSRLVRERGDMYKLEVRDDIIRLTPVQ